MFLFFFFLVWYNTNSDCSTITQEEVKLKLSHRKKITIKKDRKFNQTTSSFNLRLIPTPQEHTAEDLSVKDKYSVLLPSHMTLQKKPWNPSQEYFQSE